jgi:hypothetical protein
LYLSFPNANPDWLQHLKFTDISDRHSCFFPSNKSHFKYFIIIMTTDKCVLEL